MKKRVFIIHGWGGTPQEGWLPWLKKELDAKGFDAKVLEMPETNVPRIFNWVPFLAQAVGQVDDQTYFVGHSMGCQAIIRYLESLPEGIKVGGAVFVAGPLKSLVGLEEEEKETGAHWMDSEIDLEKVKSHLPQSVAIFSDNDQFIPPDNIEEYKKSLGSKIIQEHAKDHFSGSDGIDSLPSALEAVLELAGMK